ncbi:DUF899 family protein [Plantactinospora sp. WMMB782]|uniref:DUF899 family protein n=1 Tax=Plantactinospora sp. WMMB782 TaxID=3404121 RepID=UPI003B96097D
MTKGARRAARTREGGHPGTRCHRRRATRTPDGTDVDAPPGGGFAVNVFLRDGETVYRTWHTTGRGVEQLTFTFPLADVLPYGWREEGPAGRSLPGCGRFGACRNS